MSLHRYATRLGERLRTNRRAPRRTCENRSKRPRVEPLENRTVLSLTFPAQYGGQGTNNGGDVRTGDIPVYLIFAAGATTGFRFDGSVDENALVSAVTNILNSSYFSGLSEYGASTHAHLAGT